MGIDAEALLLTRPLKTWRLCSWAMELPRSSLGSKYSLLFHLLETGEEVQLPLLCLRDADRKLCDALSPSYQMLKALPGSWADLLPDASRLADGRRHQESFFYAHGLNSFAQSLLDYLRSEFADPAEMLTRPEFWEHRNYGALMVQAFHLSAYGPTEHDLSGAFVKGTAELRPREGRAELVGRVELQFAERLEGQLWIHAVPDSESRTFSGDKVSFDLGCRRLSRLSGKALEQLSGRRILAPPAVPSESAGFRERRWFRVVLMCLRRVMPQVPTRRVLHFARPPFPQQTVLIGLSHDHIAWQDMEWVYANPKLDVLESSEEELIDLVSQLQGYGCPFRLPFWLSEL